MHNVHAYKYINIQNFSHSMIYAFLCLSNALMYYSIEHQGTLFFKHEKFNFKKKLINIISSDKRNLKGIEVQ